MLAMFYFVKKNYVMVKNDNIELQSRCYFYVFELNPVYYLNNKLNIFELSMLK